MSEQDSSEKAPKIVIRDEVPEDRRYRRDRWKSRTDALPQESRSGFLMMAITAVLILFAAGAWFDLRGMFEKAPPPVIAQLALTQGEVSLIHQEVKSDSAKDLFHGDLVTVGEGKATVRFAEPLAEFQLAAQTHLILREGDGSRQLRMSSGALEVRLEAHAEDTPLLVACAQGVVRAPGPGRFKLAMDEEGTELRVFEGAVEIRRNDLNIFIGVKENQLLRIAPSGIIDGPRSIEEAADPPL